MAEMNVDLAVSKNGIKMGYTCQVALKIGANDDK